MPAGARGRPVVGALRRARLARRGARLRRGRPARPCAGGGPLGGRGRGGGRRVARGGDPVPSARGQLERRPAPAGRAGGLPRPVRPPLARPRRPDRRLARRSAARRLYVRVPGRPEPRRATRRRARPRADGAGSPLVTALRSRLPAPARALLERAGVTDAELEPLLRWEGDGLVLVGSAAEGFLTPE